MVAKIIDRKLIRTVSIGKNIFTASYKLMDDGTLTDLSITHCHLGLIQFINHDDCKEIITNIVLDVLEQLEQAQFHGEQYEKEASK